MQRGGGGCNLQWLYDICCEKNNLNRKITQMKRDKAGNAKTYSSEDGRNWICTVKL
jgi:hypothetical protein